MSRLIRRITALLAQKDGRNATMSISLPKHLFDVVDSIAMRFNLTRSTIVWLMVHWVLTGRRTEFEAWLSELIRKATEEQ